MPWNSRRYKTGMHLVGRRFGEVTVVELLEERRQPSGARQWLCVCDCGKQCIRTTHSLLWDQPACDDCTTETRKGRGVEYRERRCEQLRDMWYTYRSLYGPGWPEVMRGLILDDLESEFGLMRIESPNLAIDPAWKNHRSVKRYVDNWPFWWLNR